jgi:hypothetical protein
VKYALRIFIIILSLQGTLQAAETSLKLKAFIDAQILSPQVQSAYQLPAGNDVLNGLSEMVGAEFNGTPATKKTELMQHIDKGYGLELKTSGDCIDKAQQKTCLALILGQRKLNLANAKLKRVVEIYTSDLRFPNDKNIKFHGLQIYRHHWEFEGASAVEITSAATPDAMNIGHVYKIKKCRDGFMVSWKCNTIAYEIFEIDNAVTILIGRQVNTAGEPLVYRTTDCEKSATKGSCEKRFNEEQSHNTSSGTLTVAIFKSYLGPSGQSTVGITEFNVGATNDPSSVKHLALAQDSMKEGFAFEYRQLSKKLHDEFPAIDGNREVASDVSSSNANNMTIRFFGFFLGCVLAFFAAVTSIRYSSRFIIEQQAQSNNNISQLAAPKDSLEVNSELHNLTDHLKAENSVLKEKILNLNGGSTQSPSATTLVAHQRTFIHDLSTPLAVSQGMLEIVIMSTAGQKTITEKDLDRLTKALAAIEKIAELLKKNREVLRLTS